MGSNKISKGSILSRGFIWRMDILTYCWWKKSCTTWLVWNPANNGINYLSTGAGFLPSTVPPVIPSWHGVHKPPTFCRQKPVALWNPSSMLEDTGDDTLLVHKRIVSKHSKTTPRTTTQQFASSLSYLHKDPHVQKGEAIKYQKREFGSIAYSHSQLLWIVHRLYIREYLKPWQKLQHKISKISKRKHEQTPAYIYLTHLTTTFFFRRLQVWKLL